MEFELRTAKIDASTNDIRNAINDMQFTETECKNRKYFLNTPISELGIEILSTFKIKPPPRSMQAERFNIANFIA